MAGSVLEVEAESPRETEADRSLASLIVHLVASATRLKASEIVRSPRGVRATRARQVAMYLAHTGLNWTQARTGHAFGRDRTTVGNACARVEDWREDPGFDQSVSELETWLRALPPIGVLL